MTPETTERIVKALETMAESQTYISDNLFEIRLSLEEIEREVATIGRK